MEPQEPLPPQQPSDLAAEARHQLQLERLVKLHRMADKEWGVFIFAAVLCWPLALGYIVGWWWGVAMFVALAIAGPVVFFAFLFGGPDGLRAFLLVHLGLIMLAIVFGLLRIYSAYQQVKRLEHEG